MRLVPARPATPEESQRPDSFVLRCRDLDPLEDAIDGLPLEATRLDDGSGVVSLAGLQLENLSLVVGSFDFGVVTRGECASALHTIAIPLSAGEGSWNGVAIDPETLWSYAPGTEHEGYGSRPPRWAAISLDADQSPSLGEGSVSVVRGDAVSRLGHVMNAAADALEAGRLGAEMLPGLETELTEAIADALAGRVDGSVRLRASARIVRQCIEVAGEAGHMPRVGRLADALGVTERWIRSAFQAELGVSPSVFFRLRNLHRAHHAFRSSSASDTSVTEIAMSLGFWHLGRFSTAYRESFGEPPSATLARTV